MAKVRCFLAILASKLCQAFAWKTSYCRRLLPDQRKRGRASARLAVNVSKVRPIFTLASPMNTPDPSLIDRRRRVGWTALACLCAAFVGLATTEENSVWAAAAMRIGLVLGALQQLRKRHSGQAYPRFPRGRMNQSTIAAIARNGIADLIRGQSKAPITNAARRP